MNELEQKKAERTELKSKIDVATTRCAELQKLIQQIESDLINQVLSGVADFQVTAAQIAGLQLELKVLPLVVKQLNIELRPVMSRIEQIVYAEQDARLKKARDELKAKFKALRSKGETEKTIRGELGLNKHEFDRLANEY